MKQARPSWSSFLDLEFPPEADTFLFDRPQQRHAPSAMTKLRLWWGQADAALEARGEPPLSYEQAAQWFDCELDPEDVPDAIILAPAAKPRRASR